MGTVRKDSRRNKASEQLAVKNRGLVYRVIKKEFSFTLGAQDALYEELSGIGMIGLVYAANAFDPSRGNKFSSFAYPCIKGYMLRYLQGYYKYRNNVVEGGSDLFDKIEMSVEARDQKSAIKQVEIRMTIHSLMDRAPLTERERLVIHQYYLEGKVLEDVAGCMGTSRENVRLIRDKALGKLRKEAGDINL